MSEFTDFFVTILVLLGIFLMGYMAYRQQGLIDTFNEIKDMFEDRAEAIKEGVDVYK